LQPANPRTRKVAESDKWTRYEVALDVFDDVFAYGLLIVPKGIGAGERRPVVVCQHGLEGRPGDVVDGDNKSYHDFATRLAERGYITFAPQNPYIFKDRFRSLQRKANAIGKTLFSIIVPQHQQLLNWLKTLPQVDGQHIGFYGLSYGGKTAMRVPAIVTDYALSICAADFNEWVWKNAATDTFAKRYTYASKLEYEIFEWNLGTTFNYAEMAMLIAPRPFMVERGHLDGVAPDEAVAWEFARVRRFYEVNLKLPNRARIEWFVGPHTINGVGTFEFLDEWLKRGP
jgi:cephalosporin-C deacetylase-like acetyl esterase